MYICIYIVYSSDSDNHVSFNFAWHLAEKNRSGELGKGEFIRAFFFQLCVANRIGLERVTALKSGIWYVCQNARGVQVGTLINNKSLNVIEDESKHWSCEVHHMT